MFFCKNQMTTIRDSYKYIFWDQNLKNQKPIALLLAFEK